jgi:hypothetical protein
MVTHHDVVTRKLQLPMQRLSDDDEAQCDAHGCGCDCHVESFRHALLSA